MPTPKRKRRKKTVTKTQFAKELIKTGFNQTKAYQNLHPKANKITAQTESSKLAQHPLVRSKLSEALDKHGLDLDTSTQLLKETLYAGLGKNATNKDSIRVLEIILKTHKAIEDEEVDQDLSELSHNELMNELRQVKNKLNATLRDNAVEGEIVN